MKMIRYLALVLALPVLCFFTFALVVMAAFVVVGCMMIPIILFCGVIHA